MILNDLIQKAIRTPDGTFICSKFRHDYMSHLDENGSTYIVDGGLYPIGQMSIHEDQVSYVLHNDSTFTEITNKLLWGCLEDGKTVYRPICELGLLHLKNIKYQYSNKKGISYLHLAVVQHWIKEKTYAGQKR